MVIFKAEVRPANSRVAYDDTNADSSDRARLGDVFAPEREHEGES